MKIGEPLRHMGELLEGSTQGLSGNGNGLGVSCRNRRFLEMWSTLKGLNENAMNSAKKKDI